MESGFEADAFYPRLHSFCIGLEGSPDLVAAKKVADFLGKGMERIREII
jgi:asparagine synthase (glutamine-hydrolysing)